MLEAGIGGKVQCDSLGDGLISRRDMEEPISLDDGGNLLQYAPDE